MKIAQEQPALNNCPAQTGAILFAYRSVSALFANKPKNTKSGAARTLTVACAAGLTLLGMTGRAQAQSCSPSLNPIACENSLPGNTGWQITGAGDATIQGFATDISATVGQT